MTCMFFVFCFSRWLNSYNPLPTFEDMSYRILKMSLILWHLRYLFFTYQVCFFYSIKSVIYKCVNPSIFGHTLHFLILCPVICLAQFGNPRQPVTNGCCMGISQKTKCIDRSHIVLYDFCHFNFLYGRDNLSKDGSKCQTTQWPLCRLFIRLCSQ